VKVEKIKIFNINEVIMGAFNADLVTAQVTA
jgi:hypothetical protein